MTVEDALKKSQRFGAKTIWDIIDDFQIMVHYVDLGEELCGFFNKTGSCSQIVVNNQLPSGKQEFVLAHELGHAMMHGHIKQLHCTKYSIFSRDALEFEANSFAFKTLWRQNEYHSIEHFVQIHQLEVDLIKDLFGGRMGGDR